MHVSGPWEKEHLEWRDKGSRCLASLCTNQDLANVFGRTDSDFENLDFWDLLTPDFQIPTIWEIGPKSLVLHDGGTALSRDSDRLPF